MISDPKAPLPSAHVLRSRRPAADFLEAFPLGNGRMGAMVPGMPEYERIALNNPHFPALRSDPMALSGASCTKQTSSCCI
jgi:hypothetical protein